MDAKYIEIHNIFEEPATNNPNNVRKGYARETRHEPTSYLIILAEYRKNSIKLSDKPIIFTENDARGFHYSHIGSIAMNLQITSQKVYRILIDNGSSTDILFRTTYDKINLIGYPILPLETSLHVFIGDSILSDRNIILLIDLGKKP